MTTIAFATLGCRVNQYDTDSMRGLFLARGFEERQFTDAADVYVINTCSVTQMGEKKSRQLIRRAKRLNDAAAVIVTGCYAQLQPELLAAMDGVDAVIGTNEKHRIVSVVEQILQQRPNCAVTAIHDIMEFDHFEEIPLYPSAVEHTRADLKIQEGCHNFCTYCIIPYTRGSLKSRPLAAIVEEAQRLISYGFKELVLTGIHLGAYGEDLPDHPDLAQVLRHLLDETTVSRIRLGSIESLEVTDELAAVINSSSRICPHLHLPLQSGSDDILKIMNRHYDKAEYMALIRELRRLIPGLTISTDLILGFPGETESLFDETMDTLRQIQFSHIHAFPYSPRPGTPAATFDGQVPDSIKKERVALVNELSAQQKKALLQQMVGKTVRVLIEKQEGRQGEGLSEHYERVNVSGLSGNYTGSIVEVCLGSTDGHILEGMVREED